jgi:hypothetical protein
VIETVSELEVAGMLNPVTVGGLVSEPDGWLLEFPGKVLALISAAFVNPSPSESLASRAASNARAMWPGMVVLPKSVPKEFVAGVAVWQSVQLSRAVPVVPYLVLNWERYVPLGCTVLTIPKVKVIARVQKTVRLLRFMMISLIGFCSDHGFYPLQ